MTGRILVTGVNGFAGKHLVRELSRRGLDVVGASQNKQPHPEISSKLTAYWPCDLTDKRAVAELAIEGVDAVVSLAGLANVGASFDDAATYERVNVEILTVLGEEIIARKLKTRVIAVSTGAVYDARQPMPLTESSKLIESRASPYALSKLKMEQAALGLISRGLECIIARPFNHIGPGQEAGFLLPDLYQKIKTAGVNGGPIRAGDLSTRRDYTDVRDVTRAYADLVMADNLAHNLYNICSGKSVSGEEILDLLSISLGIARVKTERDPALVRPDDPREIYGSFDRLSKETRWRPEIRLEDTVVDFLKAV